MKYIVFRKEEITQDMLNSINGNQVTVPTSIYLVDPPEDEPGGVLSDYLYITTEEEFPNGFQFYRKLDETDYQDVVSKIKSGQVPKYKISNNSDQDPTGRPIVRMAATIKGWHYQAHSIQFEVNKLNSIYNKDADGNDLGYAEIKIYDDQGDECTTQGSADTNGVKTIVTWKPDFDFEIISGNVRQKDKETVDSYTHVRAKVATGLPAPYDFLTVPFTQGGINLNYIGADETLKTDGRASKLLRGSNGDHFEIIVNYEADLLTNTNRHKMSIIFEIYKDPTT
jgi:hypothetical protein